MKERKYIAIDCNFYDRLEADSTLKNTSFIKVKSENDEQLLEGRITNLFIRSKVEYLKLDDGNVVRLDDILEFNGVPMPTIK